MSMIVSDCLVVKAANGDEAAYLKLINVMTVNLVEGHFLQIPCKCTPTCRTTEENMVKLTDRIEEHFKKNPVKR